MKYDVLFLALFIVAFLFPTVGSVSNADAEKGFRLCGIGYDNKAILIKVEHPNKKKKRKKVKQLCDRLTDEMVQELIDEQIDTTDVIRYRRVSCQDFSRDISSGKNSYNLCPFMRKTKPNKEVPTK